MNNWVTLWNRCQVSRQRFFVHRKQSVYKEQRLHSRLTSRARIHHGPVRLWWLDRCVSIGVFPTPLNPGIGSIVYFSLPWRPVPQVPLAWCRLCWRSRCTLWCWLAAGSCRWMTSQTASDSKHRVRVWPIAAASQIKQGLFNYFKRPFCMVNIVQNKMPLCLLLSRITVLLQIGADIYICILLV